MMMRTMAVTVLAQLLRSVGFGQLLSLLITATGVASSRLASMGTLYYFLPNGSLGFRV
jgi:hypothetical protein